MEAPHRCLSTNYAISFLDQVQGALTPPHDLPSNLDPAAQDDVYRVHALHHVSVGDHPHAWRSTMKPLPDALPTRMRTTADATIWKTPLAEDGVAGGRDDTGGSGGAGVAVRSGDGSEGGDGRKGPTGVGVRAAMAGGGGEEGGFTLTSTHPAARRANRPARTVNGRAHLPTGHPRPPALTLVRLTGETSEPEFPISTVQTPIPGRFPRLSA